jgi:hypothetical protein
MADAIFQVHAAFCCGSPRRRHPAWRGVLALEDMGRLGRESQAFRADRKCCTARTPDCLAVCWWFSMMLYFPSLLSFLSSVCQFTIPLSRQSGICHFGFLCTTSLLPLPS